MVEEGDSREDGLTDSRVPKRRADVSSGRGRLWPRVLRHRSLYYRSERGVVVGHFVSSLVCLYVVFQ